MVKNGSVVVLSDVVVRYGIVFVFGHLREFYLTMKIPLFSRFASCLCLALDNGEAFFSQTIGFLMNLGV